MYKLAPLGVLLMLVASAVAIPFTAKKDMETRPDESLVPKATVDGVPGQLNPKTAEHEMLPGVHSYQLVYKAPVAAKQYQPRGVISHPLNKNGVPVPLTMANYGGNGSPCAGHNIGRGKSALKALGLCVVGGFLGLHRFYYEYYASGCLQLLLSAILFVVHRVVKKAAAKKKDKLTNLTCVGQFSLLLYFCCALGAVFWWGLDAVLVSSQYLVPQDDYCLHTLSLVSHIPTYGR